jgi:phosphoglycerate dehydrogenase-like enzyme
MLMGIKDIFAIREKTRRKGWDSGARATSREIYNRSVGIIGASFVGRNVIRLLKNFPVKEILVYDPYLKAAQAKELGVKKVTLDALLKTCDIVSLHAPATPETKHMLGAKQFRMMRDRAVFINTARGQCVDEKALVAELKKGRITAFIDVTDPEPPKPNHPFFRLDNVILTPHLAGMVTDYSALSKCAIEEIGNFFAGRKVSFTVTKEMLPRIA